MTLLNVEIVTQPFRKNVERVCFYETSLLVIWRAFAHHKETSELKNLQMHQFEMNFYSGCLNNFKVGPYPKEM